MSKEEYKSYIMDELCKLSAFGLRNYAAKNRIKLYSSVPTTMRNTIASTMVARTYHGNALINRA